MKTSELSYAALDVTSRGYDWSENYGEGQWQSYEAANCYACERLVISTDPQCKCGKDNQEQFEGPMMNYYYALPAFDMDAEKAARRLKDIPLCLVNFAEPDDDSDEWALALTGGGMNLAWEICAAYVALGYIPPRHFWDSLPKFASAGMTPQRRAVLAAINRGLRAESGRLKELYRRIREMRAYLLANDTARQSRKSA